MGREPQQCKQCGREIYFDGICADCRAENQKKEILALTEEEIAIRIKEICEEMEATGDLDKNHGIFIKLLDYRDSKINDRNDKAGWYRVRTCRTFIIMSCCCRRG